MNGDVADVSLRVRIASHIQPQPSCAFSVVPRCEQSVNNLCKRRCVVSRIREKRGDFLRRRRQAEQIKRRAADQSSSVGLPAGSEASFAASVLKESVDGGRTPASVINSGRFDDSAWKKRPVLDRVECQLRLFGGRVSIGGRSERFAVSFRPDGPVVNPARQRRDLLT